MAQVVAFVPDLLFGSRVMESVRAAGHEPVPAGDERALAAACSGAAAVIVDLTADAPERAEFVARHRPAGVPVLAFYSHVESDVRDLARARGFELVVPRSRMAREGPRLVGRLLGDASDASLE